jgi:hypothetical protein
MITREIVSEKLLTYLNGELWLDQLVEWAENTMVVGGFAPDEDIDLLVNIVMYLAGGDSDYFPLTWEICQDFMRQLGVPIKVVADLPL